MGHRAPNVLFFLPLPQLYHSPNEMRRKRKGGRGWGVRGEERKQPLTGDLKMRAEQGSSEEYKSQPGYPNTSKTILHISANTFGARGPGQRRLSHTCTHTHTCTHAHTRAEPLRLPPRRPLPPPLSPPPLRLFCLRSLFPRPLTKSAAKGGSKKFHSVQ